MEKLELLKSVFVFSGLEDDILSRVITKIKEVKLAKGTEIFSEGDEADSFFIVDSGEVSIYKELGPGYKKTLAVLPQGSVFGEMAFFSDSPRTANAVTKSDCLLLKIERPDFMDFIEKEPKAGLRVLSGLLQVTMDRLEQTSRELTTIYHTGKAISSGRGLEAILAEIKDEVLLAIPEATDGAVYLYNEFNQEYDPKTVINGAKEIPSNSPLIMLIKNNPSGLIDTKMDDNSYGILNFLKDAKTVLISPIKKADSLSGFVILWNSIKKGVFTNAHNLLLLSVCSQVAEAVENIKHIQEERDRARLKQAREQGY